MKLQNIFSKEKYNECLEKIKSKVFFEININKKPYKFSFDFRECDNGIWKNNLLVSYAAEIGYSGFSHPLQHDNIPRYEDMCDIVNSFWDRNDNK